LPLLAAVRGLGAIAGELSPGSGYTDI
jgi:hypothetical protein